MTDPDHPFRRPRPAVDRTGGDETPPTTPPSALGDDPVILDPDFHQTVWTPWEQKEATGPPNTVGYADPTSPSLPPKFGVARTTIMWAFVGATLALVAALAIPPLLQTPTWRPSPLVQDLATEPGIAWSVDAGENCPAGPDEDHAIMWTTKRVWSLDLRTGRSAWSVDLPGDTETVTCLPGANRVAVTDIDRFEETVIRISLLDGSTGRRVAELPGDSTVQVIPLGPNIGLVDRSNILRAVAPGKLDEPLWSQRLPGKEGTPSPIHAEQMDDTTVQLWYSLGEEALMPVLSLVDGQAPPWSQLSLTDEQYYERLGDVVLWHRNFGQTSSIAVLDLNGRELWSLEDRDPVISGSHLYTTSMAESERRELREIDPRTGAPLNDHSYTGPFDYAFAAPQGGVAVFQAGSLMILDDQLQEQGTPLDVDYGETYEGQTLLYTGGHMFQDSNDRRTRLTAIDPAGSRILWDLSLEPGQHVQQLGRHLVVIDNGGRTIHGLRSGA